MYQLEVQNIIKMKLTMSVRRFFYSFQELTFHLL